MGKLRFAICAICGRKIHRHDPKRATVKVGNSNVVVHLECYQSEKGASHQP